MIPLVDYEHELEIMRELVVRIGDEEGLHEARGLHRRDDDRAAARVFCCRPDRRARGLLLFRHERPDADRARVLAATTSSRSSCRPTWSARSSTARRSRRSTSRASAGSCGWRRGSGARRSPDLKLGICGEHGGDPDSIDFFHMAGLDYVSCSPFRVPIARVAAAQAAIIHANDRPGLTRKLRRTAESAGVAPVRMGGVTASPTQRLRRRSAGARGRVAVAAGHAAPIRRARAREEADCGLRTPFQRDRDRIVHCKAFRRLKHKTQVFVAPEGDHYRTRLTHTLEVTQISRTVARALRLNEDLTEAIGLGHDVGHPPFGHIGEDVLDALRARALRPRLPPQRALAAGGRRARGPQPHRAGARRDPAPLERRGRAGDARGQDRPAGRPDRLHQPRHRRRACAPACCAPDDLPVEEIACSGRHGLGADRHARARPRRALRARPGTSCRATRSAARCCALRSFMFERVYLGPRARAEHAKIERVLRGLFDWYCEHPEELPAGRRRSEADRVIDYLAGMTDRFAIRAWTERFVPQGLAALMARYTRRSRERVRDAVDFEELVGARTELKRAGVAAAAGPVPVPRGAHAVVRHRPGREALPLLRLRRGRRRLHVRDGDRGAGLRRARWSRWPSATA